MYIKTHTQYLFKFQCLIYIHTFTILRPELEAASSIPVTTEFTDMAVIEVTCRFIIKLKQEGAYLWDTGWSNKLCFFKFIQNNIRLSSLRLA
jgi:hypothetical protein